jgi:hypothetical protein
MITESNVHALYRVSETERAPKEIAPPPSRRNVPTRDAGMRPAQGILYGVLIGSLLWSVLILGGVLLW